MPFRLRPRAVLRLLYALLILLAAGLTGWGVMIVLLITGDVIMAFASAGSSGVGIGFVVGMVAFPFWVVGAFVVGPPLWAALHFARLTSRRSAWIGGGAAGGLSVPLALWLMSGGGVPLLNSEGGTVVAILSAIAAASGAVSGEAIHRLAYRSGEAADAR